MTVKAKTNGEDSDSNSSVWSRLKMGYNPMEEGVRWTEKYADDLERLWRKTPGFLQKFIFVLAIALLGSSLKGEIADIWFLETKKKYFNYRKTFKKIIINPTNKFQPLPHTLGTNMFVTSGIADKSLLLPAS